MFNWLHEHLGAQPARAAPLRPGFALGWVSENPAERFVGPQEAQALRESGAQLVRVDFTLGHRPQWDEARLKQYAQALDALADLGIEVLGLAGHGIVANPQQAQWTANNAEVASGNGHNPYIDAYVANLRTLVTRFHDRVRMWEIWNEPNVWTHQQRQGHAMAYSGSSYIYPSNYAVLLARAYMAIKGEAGLGDVTLVHGGLFGHSINGVRARDNSGAPYLQAVYEAGLRGPANWEAVRQRLGSYPLDAVGQHPYIDQGGPTSPEHVQAYLGWVRQTLESFEGRGTAKPTYLTEVAWKTTAVSPQVQAQNLTTLFTACAQTPYVAGCLWFQLRDSDAAHLYFGVIDVHWTRKPAFAAFQQIAASR